jgi:EAL and modified HD-GYP domain-containing signal transduction protein
VEVYLARQPIFNTKRRVAAYELLYRDAENVKEAKFVDGDHATCRLLSDAITAFGLSNLTNGKPAYINFTDHLILNDFVRLADPDEIVVELLEDIEISDLLVEKLKRLKRLGYRLALDDYVGDQRFDCILPLADVVKVDFRLTSYEEQEAIAKNLKRYRKITMLAEKVETQEEFDHALHMGFKLLQGYFFAKPTTMSEKRGSVVKSSYMRMLAELNRPEGADFGRCAQIIHADAAMTYQIIRIAQRVNYYRGNLVTAIQQALVLVGVDEVRRWILLALARDNNLTTSDELVRQAYLRGVFLQRLMRAGGSKGDPEYGFLLGMFSLLDRILGVTMDALLKEIKLPEEVVDALLGRQENEYSRLLRYVEVYELLDETQELPETGLRLDGRKISKLYMDSVIETDRVFNMTEG